MHGSLMQMLQLHNLQSKIPRNPDLLAFLEQAKLGGRAERGTVFAGAPANLVAAESPLGVNNDLNKSIISILNLFSHQPTKEQGPA